MSNCIKTHINKALHKTPVNELHQESEVKKYSGLCYNQSGPTFLW